MISIIANEKIRQQKRRRVSFLFFAFMAVAGTSGSLNVDAFGMPGMTATATRKTISGTSMSSALYMKPGNTSYRKNHGRSTNGTPSSEIISRKAALVDSNHLSERNPGIRDRVNSFLRSKKRRSKVVQEVKDIDSIHSMLGEGQKEAVYTAVIFHAPYCRACKASMPLFEELARQYNKKNRKYTNRQQKQSWREQPSPLKQPVVKFLSVPVTQDNSKELQDQFSVTKFPLAHIYDPVDGLVDERPVLRKLFSGFEKRLESVVVEAFSDTTSSATILGTNTTIA